MGHNMTNPQSECAPSKDSDQPGHSPSLTRVFAVHMKKPWVLSYHWVHSGESDQTGRMPKLIWVFAGHTVTLLVLSCRGTYAVVSFCMCLEKVDFEIILKFIQVLFESPYEKTNKMTCAPKEESDQPGHPSVFTVRMKKNLRSLATHWAHSEDWPDWVDAQADLSLCWANINLLVLSCFDSFLFFQLADIIALITLWSTFIFALNYSFSNDNHI